MADEIDRTDCPAFELLAVAYHESGHAVGAVLVSPGLAVETATIVPDGDYLGQVTYEDWRENLVPDVDDDADFVNWSDNPAPDDDDEGSGEICEHERQYLGAVDIVSSLGAVAEGMLRHGRPDKPVMAGAGFDRDDVWANAAAVLEDDIFCKAGLHHGPRGLRTDAALALIERHPHFWLAVGLVAEALMREKTLDGSEVEALVRAARETAQPSRDPRPSPRGHGEG